MSEGWRAVARLGEGLLARGERKRALEEEMELKNKYAAEEEERALRKAKVLEQLKADNEAAAEAAKAAREQFANMGDGMWAAHRTNPETGLLEVRTGGERRPTKGQIVTTDAGVFDYRSDTGEMKPLGKAKLPNPAAWSDPKTVIRGLEGEKSRALLDLDRDIASAEAKLGGARYEHQKAAYRAQIQRLRDMRSTAEGDYNSRIKQAGVGGGGSVTSYSDGGTVEVTGPENEDDVKVLGAAGDILPTSGAVHKLGDSTPPRPKAEAAQVPKEEAAKRAAREQTMDFKKELGALIAEQKRLGTKYTVEQLKELAHNNLDAE